MGSGTPFLAIFTDLDGTLLDHDTYEWDAAKPALEQCKVMGIPVNLVSSKTRGEIQRIRTAMANSDPFISENGGGIFIPDGGPCKVPNGTVFASGMWQWSLGQPYTFLVRSLRDIRQELGWNIRGFSDMTVNEISHITGLDLETSRLAAKRDYDEPCLLPQDGREYSLDSLSEAALRRGLAISVGGRFLHLHGQNNKGNAVRTLISWYRANHAGMSHGVILGGLLYDVSGVTRNNQQALTRVAEPERAIAGSEHLGICFDRRYESVVGQVTQQWNDLHVADALQAARLTAVQHLRQSNRFLTVTKYHVSPPECVACDRRVQSPDESC